MGTPSPHPPQEKEVLKLFDAADILISEARMILPGIQALFGFQLIAVLNASFGEKLSPLEQRLHLLAMVLVIMATAIIMTPAAYHRQTGTRQVTQRFINASTRLLLWGVVLVAISINLEVYLIGRIILQNTVLSLLLAIALLAVFLLLWFVLPNSESLQHLLGVEGDQNPSHQ